jgi:hypothetical protein
LAAFSLSFFCLSALIAFCPAWCPPPPVRRPPPRFGPISSSAADDDDDDVRDDHRARQSAVEKARVEGTRITFFSLH